MFEFLFGKRNPTRDWASYDGRRLRFNVNDGSLNDTRIGEPLERASFLGPVEGRANYSDGELRYYSLGLCVDYEPSDQRISGFHVVYRDPLDDKYSRFGGEVVYGGQAIDLANMQL